MPADEKNLAPVYDRIPHSSLRIGMARRLSQMGVDERARLQTAERASGPMKPPLFPIPHSALLKFQVFPKLRRLHPQVDVELAKVPIARADLIEAHFVNDLLNRVQLVGDQRHAPFPIIHAG